MRHSRRAVMAERYKLYMKKNIFNGKYFVRNLQIGICTIAVAALVMGTVVFLNTGKEQETIAVSAGVSVKEALFGNSEEATVANVTDTEEVTVAVTEEASTEIVLAETKTTEENDEMSNQSAEQQVDKSEFDGKCIANVEETLNIRKDASSDAEFLGSMNPGAIAIVKGTEGEWTKIKSGDVEGYVLTDYILTGEAAEQYAKNYVTLLGTVLEDGVNVRLEKSTTAEIIAVLEKDDTITVLENPNDEAADIEEAPHPNDKKDLATTENGTEATSSEQMTEEQEAEVNTEEQTTEVTTEVNTTEQNTTEQNTEEQTIAEKNTEKSIQWVSVMLADGQTGYVSADLVDVDKLYAIAVSADELTRQAEEKAAAEKAAADEAARQAAAASSNSNTNASSNANSGNNDSYKGATTTPVTATESGECIGTFTITAYCGCKKCSAGHNKTASGTTPTEGRTIAADTNVLPFGTQVVISGIVYTVEDRGSGVNGNHIDIFFSTHKKALAYGTKTIKVYKY